MVFGYVFIRNSLFFKYCVRIHCFCYPAALTHGTVSGDIPAISEGAKRLAQGIAAHFYREDIDEHYARMQRYDEPELLGDEWTPAVSNKN